MGQFDLPATLDYITNLTGLEKVAYIGHSQGTTQMFYGLAVNEEYFAQKVSIFIAIAPVTIIPNTQTLIFRLASQFYNEIDDTLKVFKIFTIMNRTNFTVTGYYYACLVAPSICY